MQTKQNKQVSINIRIGARMALLIIAVSLCIIGTALFAGSKRYAQMQIEANKEIGFELGRTTAILVDQDNYVRYIMQVRDIYENAPADLRDVPEDPDATVAYARTGGAYEALFSKVRTPAYEMDRETLSKAARECNAIDISIVLADLKRGRLVYVICGISDEKEYAADYFAAPGFWEEGYDFVIDYMKDPSTEPRGVHTGFVSKSGDEIMNSIVPFYDPDTKEVLGFVAMERPWTHLDRERMRFIAGFTLSVGIVTLLLVALSETVLHFFIVRPLNKLTAEQSRMATELDVASSIQLSMLPDLKGGTGTAGYQICAKLIPAKEVGGDFYDCFVIDEDHIAIVIADVVGKGVPASLFSMVAKTMLMMSALEGHPPARVCGEVNDRLCENNKEAMFVTVWFGIYCASQKRLAYVNAGHDSAAVYANGEWSFDTADSDMAFGIMPGLAYREHEMMLAEDSRVFLYTDGVIEAQPEESGTNLYGEERLIACLRNNRGKTGDEVIDAVYEDTCAFIGNSMQFDDITMVILDV